MICSRDTKTITETAAEIAEKSGAHVMAVAADVSLPADVKRLVESAITRFGRVDILVTNGGGPPAGRFESLSEAQWEAAVRLTLFSAIDLAREVLPGMKERHWGEFSTSPPSP